MGFKKILSATAALGLLATASTAWADNVYTYTIPNGGGLTQYGVGTAAGQSSGPVTMTIDTTTGTGTLVGNGQNISFSGNFSGFTGLSSSNYNITINPNSTINYNGSVYTLDPTQAHGDMLMLTGTGVNLWAMWTSPTCAGGNCITLGDTVDGISSSSSSGSTSSTSSGTSSSGSTSSGTTSSGSTSSGSTSSGSVSEPSDFALFAIGVVGLMIGRRKSVRKSIAA